MSVFCVKERRLAFQRVRKSALHCCVPKCTGSSRYNSTLSFHSFPIEPAVRAEWMRRIRRDNFSPTKHSRVCGRHFKVEDFVLTTGGLKRLQKGSVPVLFPWNEYELPTPRMSVWERCQRPESPDPVSDEEMEATDVTSADHDYAVTAQTGVRANALAEENKALHQRILELENKIDGLANKIEVLTLGQRFGIHRFDVSDDNFRFYTRFASRAHFEAFWSLVEPAATRKMIRITSCNSSSSSSGSHQTVCAIGLGYTNIHLDLTASRSSAAKHQCYQHQYYVDQ